MSLWAQWYSAFRPCTRPWIQSPAFTRSPPPKKSHLKGKLNFLSWHAIVFSSGNYEFQFILLSVGAFIMYFWDIQFYNIFYLILLNLHLNTIGRFFRYLWNILKLNEEFIKPCVIALGLLECILQWNRKLSLQLVCIALH